jgi:Asp/Glu/hydantoin racemase
MTQQTAVPTLCLLNPNTNSATTVMMTAIANETAGGKAHFVGQTMPSGPPIIVDEKSLQAAGPQIVKAGIEAAAAGYAGILIAGFGDPGLDELRQRVPIPVVGIAEASMAAACIGGRRFSVVTTTPDLKEAISGTATRYGCSQHLATVRITPGEAEETMRNPDLLAKALLTLCRDAISTDGAQAIIIGGGPLAVAARQIAPALSVPLIEPVNAGARYIVGRVLENIAG